MIYRLADNRVSRTYCGGERIDSFTGGSFSGTQYPEDWTASTVCARSPEGVKEGIGTTVDGRRITDITGKGGLPILVKLLDAGERLAVQVHPTAEFARQHFGSRFGKTESWYMLDCSGDAYVYLGFRRGVTRAAWRDAIAKGDSELILSMLCRLPVKKGDFVFVDGGIVHAIGKGCFLAELQEPSDLTLVAEAKTVSGRAIPTFRLDMGLGLDKALDMYDYTGFTEDEVRKKYVSHPIPEANGTICVCSEKLTDKFAMSILCGNSEYVPTRSYAVAIAASGTGTVCGMRAEKGDRFLISTADELNGRIVCSGEKDFSVILCE